MTNPKADFQLVSKEKVQLTHAICCAQNRFRVAKWMFIQQLEKGSVITFLCMLYNVSLSNFDTFVACICTLSSRIFIGLDVTSFRDWLLLIQVFNEKNRGMNEAHGLFVNVIFNQSIITSFVAYSEALLLTSNSHWLMK